MAIARQDLGQVRTAAALIIRDYKADGDLYAISGLAAMKLGYLSIAQRHLRRAVSLGADSPNIDQARGLLPDVEDVVRQVLAVNPFTDSFSEADLEQAMYACDRTRECMEQGWHEEAIQIAQAAMPRCGRFTPLANNLVRSLILFGDFTKARSVAARALADNPADLFAHANLAQLLWILGDRNGASAQLKSAPPVQPSRGEGLSFYLEVALKCGEPSAAIEFWNAYAGDREEMHPDLLRQDHLIVAWAHQRLGDSKAAAAVLRRLPFAARHAPVIREALKQLSLPRFWSGGRRMPAKHLYWGSDRSSCPIRSSANSNISLPGDGDRTTIGSTWAPSW